MNVIVIVVDTLRRDAIAPYDGRVDTPHLSRIAKKCVTFDDVTATSCWTMPTHASMLTGEYPSVHKAVRSNEGLLPSIPIVSELLGESGYRTYCLNPPHPLNGDVGFRDRGWDRWHNTYADPKLTQFRRLLGVWTQEGLLKRPRHALSPAFLRAVRTNYRTRWTLNEIVDVVNDPSDSFVFANLFAVHRDYEPFPPDVPDVSEGALNISRREDDHQYRFNYGDPSLPDSVVEELWELYAGGVKWLDAKLGAFFDHMAAADLLNDSVVIVTADHGELFDESSEPPRVAHFNSLHPVLIDVPLLLYHPDIEPGRDDRLVSQVDVAPTILDAAGVLNDHRKAIDEMAGHSLLSDANHDTVFAEHTAMEPPSSEIAERYGLDFSPYERAYKAARTTKYTVRFRSDGTTVAHNRQDPDTSVPHDEIKRLRTLVDDCFEWDVGTPTVSDAVRKQLEQVGYLG